MHLLLFSIVVICIAGSRTQEIAIGTEHLRADVNGFLSSESAINAQGPVVESGAFVVIDTTSTTTSTAPPVPVNADVPEIVDDKKTSYDHEHTFHHEHDATISVDLHNIVDLFKQQLQESEKRILAAINAAPAAPAVKSYRTADR